ncbi:MAG: hypothetical protein MUP82_03845 [Candidatus Marinimicrobia bacterium]|nr:hypothetical protein [Candidatus Neomarinimicrobiota bacterium]
MYYIENKEILLLDPSKFGLSTRALIGKYSNNHFVLIKDRKSRIIMKDGRQILEQVEKVKSHAPEAEINIATNTRVCGKTTKFLNEKGIRIYPLEK